MQGEKILEEATLIFLRRDSKICLAEKARYIGKGRRNGYGGGVENGQARRVSAKIELLDESSVICNIQDLEKVAIIIVHNENSDGKKFVCNVHVYFLSKFEGEPQESEEMLDPQWYNENEMPYDQMMPADKAWIERILRGEKFIAEFELSPFQKKQVGEIKFEVVDKFSDD